MRINRRHLMQGTAALGFVAAAPAIVRAQEPRAKIRLGLVRLISSGPIFIAEAKKLFDKVNLDVEFSYFADGALAMPALVAGELDLTASTLNAGVFNTVSMASVISSGPKPRPMMSPIEVFSSPEPPSVTW